MFDTVFLKTTLSRLLVMACLVGGFLAYSNMIKESVPDLEIGAATIITYWPGSDAQTIELEVTNVLEKELKSISGMKRLMSGSFSGFSVVVAEFHPNVPQAEAMAHVRAKVSQAQGFLPKASERPVVQPVNISDSPIVSINLYGDQPLRSLSLQAKKIKKSLERISGVNKVVVNGDRQEIVMVRLIPARLTGLGISTDQVKNAIQSANLDMPWGRFDGEEIGSNFRLFGKVRSIEQLNGIPIKTLASGRVVFLSEIAVVERTLEKEEVRTFFSAGGNEFARTINVSFTKRPGSDVIKVIEEAQLVLEKMRNRSDWPQGMEYDITYDESESIWASLKGVFDNAWQAMLAVFVILFISLSWREALLAGLAIPITFAATLMIIALIGYSLNQIVIIGLVLALGLLVDDFILMMEGMHENIFTRKQSFPEAATRTVKTYAVASLSGSMTTILAMAPLIGIAGVTGKFIRPMPIATIVALCVSYVVSLVILIPLSRYLFSQVSKDHKPSRIDKLTEIYSEKLRKFIAAGFVKNRRTAGFWVGCSVVLLTISALAFSTLPSQLMSKEDGRSLGVLVELAPNTSLDNSQICADALGDALRQVPYLQSVTKLVGAKSPFSMSSLSDQLSSSTGNHLVGFTAVFTPKDQREALAYKYVPEIRTLLKQRMAACPSGTLFLTPQLGGDSPEDPIQIELVGEDMNQLRRLSEKVIELLRQVPGATDVRDNSGALEIDIKARPKLEVIEFYGLTVAEVADQVRTALAQDKIGKFSQSGTEDDLDIFIGFSWPSREGNIGGPTTMAELTTLTVTNSEGMVIPLGSLMDFELSESALSIVHKDAQRSLTVLAKVSERTAQEILEDVKPELKSLVWPEGYEYAFAGEAAASEETFGSSRTMMLLALFLVFALLVLQFDSFTQPLIIMSAIPLALTGTFLGFFVLQLPFSFMAMVGVIALVGIVVNDTIIMIETMNNHRKAGLTIIEAAARGASDRLRPIVTTSVTTIVGLLPLSLGQEMWLPLGVTVISGLLFATFLALLIVPCLYVLLTRDVVVSENVAEAPVV